MSCWFSGTESPRPGIGGGVDGWGWGSLRDFPPLPPANGGSFLGVARVKMADGTSALPPGVFSRWRVDLGSGARGMGLNRTVVEQQIIVIGE